MTDQLGLPRRIIVLGIVLPIAALVGYLLVNPDFFSAVLLFALVMLLMMPVFLRWHHPMLVFSWNFPMIVFFLPGSPPLWMVLALISIGITVLGAGLDKEQKLVHVPVMNWVMLVWVVVVVFTMRMTTGGLGLSSLGGAMHGGKKYFYILLGVVAFFAVSTRRVPVQKGNAYLQAFLVSALATVLVSLVYSLGPAFWKFYYLFPVDYAMYQAADDFSWDPTSARFGRNSGLAVGGSAAAAFLFARYGVSGIFDWTKPWRLLVFLAVAALSTLGGFRSTMISLGILFALQFMLEGLHRTRLLLVLLVTGILGLAMLVPFANKLPLSIQRSLTILPLELHPEVRMDTKASTEWRLRMWQVLWPEIPKYFWVGKGFTASASDYYLVNESVRRGFSQGYEGAIIAGDYHSGPLSVILPYGIWGALAFLFLIGAGFRVLWNNYRHGDPALRKVNVFLLSSFLAKTIMFLGVYGAIHADFVAFAGLLAMSIALNGGECKARQEEDLKQEPQQDSAPVPRPAPFFPGRGLAQR
jgi:O-antigen ligase